MLSGVGGDPLGSFFRLRHGGYGKEYPATRVYGEHDADRFLAGNADVMHHGVDDELHLGGVVIQDLHALLEPRRNEFRQCQE